MIDDARLQPKMTTALEIAVLARIIPIEQAADLIEQYANTVAAGAKCDATETAYQRMDALMRDFHRPRPTAAEFAEQVDRVSEEMSR